MAKTFSSKSEEKRYKEDILSFRMSALFILTVIAVIFLLRLKASQRMQVELYVLSMSTAARIISGILVLASCAWFLLCQIKKTDESFRTISSANIACIVTYISAFFLYWGTTYEPHFEAVLVLTVSLPILYIIFHLFKKDFFIFSASNLLFCSTLFMTTFSTLPALVFAAILLLGCACVCLFVFRLSKKQKSDSKYTFRFTPVYFSFLITIVLISLANIMSIALVAFAKWYVFLAQYLIFAIYYTIKLFKGE